MLSQYFSYLVIVFWQRSSHACVEDKTGKVVCCHCVKGNLNVCEADEW